MNLCKRCGKNIKLGSFAYNQNICIDCFIIEIEIIKRRIELYPSWLHEKREQHIQMVNWMTKVCTGVNIETDSLRETLSCKEICDGCLYFGYNGICHSKDKCMMRTGQKPIGYFTINNLIREVYHEC